MEAAVRWARMEEGWAVWSVKRRGEEVVEMVAEVDEVERGAGGRDGGVG